MFVCSLWISYNISQIPAPLPHSISHSLSLTITLSPPNSLTPYSLPPYSLPITLTPLHSHPLTLSPLTFFLSPSLSHPPSHPPLIPLSFPFSSSLIFVYLLSLFLSLISLFPLTVMTQSLFLLRSLTLTSFSLPLLNPTNSFLHFSVIPASYFLWIPLAPFLTRLAFISHSFLLTSFSALLLPSPSFTFSKQLVQAPMYSTPLFLKQIVNNLTIMYKTQATLRFPINGGTLINVSCFFRPSPELIRTPTLRVVSFKECK